MRFYWFLLGALAVWRITHLLQAEDGPWDSLVGLRRMAGRSFIGALLDCFYCLTIWIAAPFAYWLGEGWKEKLLLWPALSAAGILLERIGALRESAAPYFEEPEDRDVLLREDERTVPGSKRGS
jgi:uncharacterized protein DUF1360